MADVKQPLGLMAIGAGIAAIGLVLFLIGVVNTPDEPFADPAIAAQIARLIGGGLIMAGGLMGLIGLFQLGSRLMSPETPAPR